MFSYLTAICVFLIMLVPPAWAGVQLRRRLLSGWTGAPALVVDVVLWAAQIIVVPELLGAFDLFRRATVAVALAAAGGGIGWLAGRSPGGAPAGAGVRGVGNAGLEQDVRESASRVETVLAAGIGLLFCLPWAAYLTANWQFGIFTYDSLSYHLPFAARWVQTGSTWRVQQVAPGLTSSYNPGSAEIVHALGMLAFRNDLVSPVVNVLWLGLVAAAAWSIGRPFGRGPHCMALALLVADCPLMLATQPGGALNDLMLVALTLAAVAIFLEGRDRRPAAIPLGLALGLAAGTKLDAFGAVAVIFVGAIALAPGHERGGVAARLFLATPLAGGYFYLRNLVAVDNPLPGIPGHLFPPVKAPVDTAYGQTIFQYLDKLSVIRGWLLPGLRTDFGTLWPLWLLLCVTGVVGILVSAPSSAHRVAGVAALVTFMTYVVTPTSAGGPPGEPYLFYVNVRYAMASFVLAAVLLPVVPSLRGRRWGYGLLGMTGVLALSDLTSRPSWPSSAGVFDRIGWTATAVLEVVPVLVVLALAWLWIRTQSRERRRALLGVGAAIAGVGVVALGFGVDRRYIPREFTDIPALPAVDRWGGSVAHARIGVVGVAYRLPFLYPFYGPDLSNFVQMVGYLGADPQFVTPATCVVFRTTVNRGHYKYVVFSSDYANKPLPPQDAWLRRAVGAVRVFQSHDSTAYRIDHPLDPFSCPR